jgi:perosamine synthetase
VRTYPLFRVHVPIEEALENISRVFVSGYINEGTQVTRLAEKLSGYLRTTNLVLTNSCTSALTMALKLAGVGPGDEVVSTPMTCVATNTAIASTGAKVVWADVDPRHGMLSADTVFRRGVVTYKTKAVMAVAWAGTPPALQPLYEGCVDRGTKLVLDAAHAFDARYMGAHVHQWAHYTAYSYQAIKHFTTGDGGSLVCLDAADHKRAKAMKWFGLDRDVAKDDKGDWKGQQWDVDIVEAGYKFNMNNVAAAIGLSQLPHIDRIMAAHRRNGKDYDALFSDFSPVVPCFRPMGGEPSCWVYTVLVDPKHSKLSRDDLLQALNAEGIMAGVVHVPNDTYTCFAQSKADLPGVREFSANQLSLPCGWWLDAEDILHVANRVKELTT